MKNNENFIYFTKYHCQGNDYIYIDLMNKNSKNYANFFSVFSTNFCNGNNTFLTKNNEVFGKNTAFFVQNACKKHFGICADGVVFLLSPLDKKCNVKMKMFNSDGSVGLICGTALRSIGQYFFEKFSLSKILVETDVGVKKVCKNDDNSVTAELGKAKFDINCDICSPLNSKILSSLGVNLVDLGNIHAVLFTPKINSFPLEKFYKKISPLINKPFNLEIAHIKNDKIFSRVYENGSKETLCCGSGACAIVASAFKIGIFTDFLPKNVAFFGGTVSLKCYQDYSMEITSTVKKVCDGIYYFG